MSTTLCWHRFPSFGMHARPYAFGQSTSSSALCSSSPLSRILRQKARRFTGITWNNILIPGDTIGYGDTPLHYTSVVPVSFLLTLWLLCVMFAAMTFLKPMWSPPSFLINQVSHSIWLIPSISKGSHVNFTISRCISRIPHQNRWQGSIKTNPTESLVD